MLMMERWMQPVKYMGKLENGENQIKLKNIERREANSTLNNEQQT